MIFQKKARCQGNKFEILLGNTALKHTLNYTYLGLTITASGSVSMAVNALKEKAWRPLYGIKRKNLIWLKIFDSIIQPIALYGSEIWGPLSQQNYSKWDKHPIETLHVEFCRNILKIQRKTPNNACRAELGHYPLMINIQKRALKFWMHLNSSPQDTLQFKAMKAQELSHEKSPLGQLVMKLTNPLTQLTQNTEQFHTSTAYHQQIKVNKVMKQTKKSYLEYWNDLTKTQNKLDC